MPSKFMITPEALRALSPCAERWRVYAAKFTTPDEHPLADVIDSNGVNDVLWVLDALGDHAEARRVRVLFGCWCAEQSLVFYEKEYPNDSRPRDAVNASRNALLNPSPETEAARSAAESAARSAARSAAWNAAESAARSAARSAAWNAAESAQENFLRRLLDGFDVL